MKRSRYLLDSIRPRTTNNVLAQIPWKYASLKGSRLPHRAKLVFGDSLEIILDLGLAAKGWRLFPTLRAAPDFPPSPPGLHAGSQQAGA